MNIGKRIKQARKWAGLSQQQLADSLKLSFMTIRRWESGEISPRVQELENASQVLDTPVEYLIGLTNDLEIGKIKDFDDKLENMIDKARTKKFSNLTLGETDDMLIYNDGEQSIRLKNTYKNKSVFNRVVHKMLDTIAQNFTECQELQSTGKDNTTNSTSVDIHDNNIVKDNAINIGAM